MRVNARELASVAGSLVSVPDRAVFTHLQFRRFAGCPVCDLHLRSIVRRHAEIAAAGVREVVVFHSSREELREYGAHELPFPVIADPAKRLYAEFGVESAPKSLVDPRAWWPIVRAVAASIWLIFRAKAPLRVPSGEGGRLGLPADFLIDGAGRVCAAKYGEYVDDQWSVDEILELVGTQTRYPQTSDPLVS
jgi:peroxiredoxin